MKKFAKKNARILQKIQKFHDKNGNYAKTKILRKTNAKF